MFSYYILYITMQYIAIRKFLESILYFYGGRRREKKC
nr:MAG TPA: hypothetical protein [Caudoviricetes sp.]